MPTLIPSNFVSIYNTFIANEELGKPAFFPKTLAAHDKFMTCLITLRHSIAIHRSIWIWRSSSWLLHSFRRKSRTALNMQDTHQMLQIHFQQFPSSFVQGNKFRCRSPSFTYLENWMHIIVVCFIDKSTLTFKTMDLSGVFVVYRSILLQFIFPFPICLYSLWGDS